MKELTFVDIFYYTDSVEKSQGGNAVLKDLTQGNIYKNFFLFGMPAVLAGLLSQSHAIINTAMAGQYLGEAGLAASGAIEPLSTVVNAFFWGYGTGFSIYIARLFALKEYSRIKSAVFSTFMLMLALSVLIGGAMLLFQDQIFTLLKVPDEVAEESFKAYFVRQIGLFFLVTNATWVMVLNSFGIGSFPLITSIVSAVVNITLNVFCLTVWHTGVWGLTLSSVISCAVVFVCYFLKFRSCMKQMGVHKEKVKLSLSLVRNSLPYALPTCFQQVAMYFCGLLIAPLCNGLGKEALASRTVANQLYNLCACVYQNSTKACTNYVAQSSGKGEYQNISKGLRVGFLQSSVIVTPFVLACVLFYKPVCSLFLNANSSEITRAFSYEFARFWLPFVYFNVVNNLFHGLFRATKASVHLFSSTMFGSLIRALFTYLFIPTMQMRGYFFGWVLSWIAECILVLAMYFIGKWKPKEMIEKEKSVA